MLISISDEGVGLPAGKADEIYNAFFTTKPQGVVSRLMWKKPWRVLPANRLSL